MVAIVSIVGGADSFDDIEIFAESHFDWFRKFLKLENGVPSHDTFERVFARIDPNVNTKRISISICSVGTRFGRVFFRLKSLQLTARRCEAQSVPGKLSLPFI